MNKIHSVTIVLIILAVGVVLILSKGKGAEAPTLETQPETITSVDNNQTVKEFVVAGQNFSFAPSLITVKKGDKVKITFKNTLGFHDFKIDGYGIATKQAQSPSEEVLEFTADKAGSFEYYCSVGTHRALGMKGVLRVE